MKLTFEELGTKLEDKFSGKINCYTQHKCNFIRVKAVEDLKSVIAALKEEFSFKYIVDVIATHWPKKKEEFEVTYNLFSIQNKIRVFVKLSQESCVFPTITDLYEGANYMEREEYDLVGIKFEGHPDLRRMLMPDWFEGHPLRKDFPLKERSWFNNVDEQGLGIKFEK